MKKNVFVGLVIVLSIFLESKLFNKSEVYEEEKSIKNNNTLSMMIEQTAGVGDYELETRSSWPTEGYIFNSTLSKCENGSKLSWDDDTNSVVFSGSVSDKCYVYFDKYNAVKINSSSAVVSGNSIIVSIDATAGDGAISKYYYSKDDGLSYTDSTSNTYTFSSLATGDYTIKYYVEDTNGKPSEVITKQLSVTSVTLASWVKSQYTGTQGENNLYYHDSTLENGAGDNSYRYAGSSDSTNNFVCFGSDSESCPRNNDRYRIIGVFGDQVKLIKWDYAITTSIGTDGGYVNTYSSAGYSGTNKGNSATTSIGVYYWNRTGVNTWSTSTLNTTNLNTNYINNIDSTWANKIAETTWKVGGNTYANIASVTVPNAYKNEYTSPAETTTHSDKIGLMYTSDYGFAASPSAWTTALSSYSNVKLVNWMYMGLYEWTVVRRSDDIYTSFYVSTDGSVNKVTVNDLSFAVRPVFYLNSDVTYVSGTGEKNSPIVIE